MKYSLFSFTSAASLAVIPTACSDSDSSPQKPEDVRNNLNRIGINGTFIGFQGAKCEQSNQQVQALARGNPDVAVEISSAQATFKIIASNCSATYTITSATENSLSGNIVADTKKGNGCEDSFEGKYTFQDPILRLTDQDGDCLPLIRVNSGGGNPQIDNDGVTPDVPGIDTPQDGEDNDDNE